MTAQKDDEIFFTSYKPANMYLMVNIVLIIVAYQCLTISTFQFGIGEYRSDTSSKSSKLLFINVFYYF